MNYEIVIIVYVIMMSYGMLRIELLLMNVNGSCGLNMVVLLLIRCVMLCMVVIVLSVMMNGGRCRNEISLLLIVLNMRLIVSVNGMLS